MDKEPEFLFGINPVLEKLRPLLMTSLKSSLPKAPLLRLYEALTRKRGVSGYE
jgi:hypothetical protein